MLVNGMDILKPIIEDHKNKMNLSLEKQLSELVKRGLLVMETSQPIMIRDFDGGIRIEQSVNLKLRDHEYMEELERKVNHYEAILSVVSCEKGR